MGAAGVESPNPYAPPDTPHPEGRAPEAHEQGSEEDRTVVVNKLPLADPHETEERLIEAFSTFGHVVRMTIHRSPDRQAAVLVFNSVEAAERAAGFEGELLGGPVEVFRAASSLEGNTAGRRLLRVATDGTAVVLAESYILGSKGLRVIKNWDEKTGVTAKLKEYDEQNRISETLTKAAHGVVSGVEAIDNRFQVSHRVAEGASAVQQRAMQNQYIAAGVSTTTHALGSVLGWGKRTVETAKQMVQDRSTAAPPGGAEAPAEPSAEALPTATAVTEPMDAPPAPPQNLV